MPGRFHFHRIENPIWIFRFAGEVVGDITSSVALDVDGGAGLQFCTDPFIATAVNDCVHVHVTREMGGELGAITGKQIENPGGKVTRGDNFRKGEGSERVCSRSKGYDGVTAGNDGRNNRNQSEQGRLVRCQRDDHPRRLRNSKI